MSLESLTDTLSPEENSFFESGGDKPIPSDAGSDPAGNASDGSPAPKAGETENKGGDQGEKRTVPLAELMAERDRRKAIDKEFRETQQQLAELRGKFSIVEKLGLGGEPEQPKGPPKVEEDIFGAVNGQAETLAQIQKRLDDADAATKAQTEQATFVNNYKADAAKFEETNTDFKAAYDFLLNSRAAELKAIGYDTPQTLHEALMADELALAQMAFSKQKSPAEMFYALAKQRGYVKADGTPAGKPAADTGKAAEKLDTIERGQNANKSLNNAGGGATPDGMTAQQLIDMPMAEFEAWTTKNPAKAKQLLGG